MNNLINNNVIYEKDSIFEKDSFTIKDSTFEKDSFTLKDSIFEKDSFTLKELCNTFILNKDKKDIYGENIINQSIVDIINCYLAFSSCNSNYKKYLCNVRGTKGLFLKNNVSFREMLMIFDLEFTKLVIHIKTEPEDYDITITWDEFNNKMKNTNKDELYEFYKKLVYENKKIE